MTRANLGQFYQLNLELERNLRKSRRRLELMCSTEGAPSSSEPTIESVPLESPPVINISSDPSPEPEIQEDRMEERTIRESWLHRMQQLHKTCASNIQMENVSLSLG